VSTQKSVWTIPGLHERFMALAGARLSGQQIADILSKEIERNFTRCMVLGYAFRRGVKLAGLVQPALRRESPRREQVLEARRASRRQKARAKDQVKAQPAPVAAEAAETKEVFVSINPAFFGPRAVLALGPDTCRWPMGDPTAANFRFCCAPIGPRGKKARLPYCECHYSRAVLLRSTENTENICIGANTGDPHA